MPRAVPWLSKSDAPNVAKYSRLEAKAIGIPPSESPKDLRQARASVVVCAARTTNAHLVTVQMYDSADEANTCSARPHNGLEVNPRGQGPRAEAAAARRMPAFEARDAGGVTPCKLR